MAGSNSLWGRGQCAAEPSERCALVAEHRAQHVRALVKLLKTDRVRSWRFDKTARSIFLMDFVSAFVLALRYFFKPKVTLN